MRCLRRLATSPEKSEVLEPLNKTLSPTCSATRMSANTFGQPSGRQTHPIGECLHLPHAHRCHTDASRYWAQRHLAWQCTTDSPISNKTVAEKPHSTQARAWNKELEPKCAYRMDTVTCARRSEEAWWHVVRDAWWWQHLEVQRQWAHTMET